nr:putative monosaccharide biosynthesis protein [Vibrio mimicus]
MNTVNIACWSIGEHAKRNILPTIELHSDVNLIGVYTRDLETKLNVSTQYGCKSYLNERELLEDENVHAVYISSPTSEHYSQIKQCLLHGKSVLVEKTALPNPELTLQCINLAREKELFVMEAFMYRFHKQFSALLSILSNSEYGEIKKIDCEFGFPHLDGKNIRYKKALEGGALFDAGAYTLSSIRHLLGERVKVISALVMSEEEYEVDTFGTATLLAEDIIATATWGFGLSYANKIKVWTDKVHIEVDRAYSKREEPYKIQISANGNIIELIEVEPDNHFYHMFSHFCSALINETTKNECLDDLFHQSQLLNEVRILGSKNEN